MVIDYVTLSLEFDTREQLCSYLDSHRDKIKQILSIGPNLHANKYVLYYEEYMDKEYKLKRLTKKKKK